MAKEKRFPVLKGILTPSGRVKAWCPFCKKWHLHGYPERKKPGLSAGHWAPHCETSDSPFWGGGYEIRLMTKKEIHNISDSLNYCEN